MFLIWKGNNEELSKAVNIFNEQYDSTKFTIEKERNKTLNYLDISVIKNGSKLGCKVCRKPTTTDISINNRPEHHPRDKNTSVIRSHIRRAITHSSNNDYLQEQLNNIEAIAVRNYFNRKIIDKMLKK